MLNYAYDKERQDTFIRSPDSAQVSKPPLKDVQVVFSVFMDMLHHYYLPMLTPAASLTTLFVLSALEGTCQEAILHYAVCFVGFCEKVMLCEGSQGLSIFFPY
jgi:hypothetical protein